MEKKDSIFAGLNPAPVSAPAPVSVPAPAARAAVTDQEVADLKRKIDAMEKNIVSQLEKKIGDTLKAAAPTPPPPPPPSSPRPPDLNSQFLLVKIGELDKRLEEFTRNAMVSSVQMKNIEESKISARREIEDLLKVVREQQKYSEMDRAMHEQLEKAWTRAEELEKKLMDFYSSVLSMEAGRREDSSAASGKSAAAIEALSARLARIEEKLSGSSDKSAAAIEALSARFVRVEEKLLSSSDKSAAAIEALSARFARIDEKLSGSLDRSAAAVETLSARLAGFEEKLSGFTARTGEELRLAQGEFFARAEADRKSDARQLVADMKENAASFKEVLDSHVRGEIALVRGTISEELQTLRREMSASAEVARELLRGQADLSAKQICEIEKIAQGHKAWVDGVNAALEDSARRQALALEEFTRRIGVELGSLNADRAAIERFIAVMGSAEASLVSTRDIVRDMLKDVSPAQLEQSMGVSGLLLRRRFETLPSELGTLQDGLLRLREIKLGVERRFKDLFENP